MAEQFYPVENRILGLLYHSKVSMTIYEISDKLYMSFPTAKKYLQSLVAKGVVIEDVSLSKLFPSYKLNFDLLKDAKAKKTSDKQELQDNSTAGNIKERKNPSKLRIADIFAGVGGMRLAFEKEGFTTVFANDIDKYSETVYNANFSKPEMTLVDIADMDLRSLPIFDILLSTFPCQSFNTSDYREGLKNTQDNPQIFFKIIKVIAEKKPQAFLLETAKSLRNYNRGQTFDTISKTLTELGYNIKVAIINSATHGNIPQNRERLFIVGFRDKELCNIFMFPNKISLTTKVTDFLETRLIDNKYYYNDKPLYKKIVNDVNKDTTVYQLRMGHIQANNNGLIPALATNMGAGGHNVPIFKDDKGIRKLTPRECFSIQGFPKNFKLPQQIADSHLYHQAGNSVTISIIQRIAAEMKRVLVKFK